MTLEHDTHIGPPRPTEEDLDALALEEDRKRAMEALGDMTPAAYGQQRQYISETYETPLGWLDDEYRERRRAAKASEAPTSAFLELPEPWPEPVAGVGLLDEIASTLQRYVVLPEHAATAITLWIFHAHLLSSTTVTPILAIESPEKRCGKTTLLGIIQNLVPKSLTAANMTPATVFRAVEQYQPTLVVDEGDTFLTADKGELIGIFNSGHTRTSAYVFRIVGENHEVRRFSTWCAKVIALIGVLPPTLQDRSIVVSMRRRQKGERVERFRVDRTTHLQELCRKAARWAADHAEALARHDPTVSEQMDDRAADNWRPLIAIADLVGGDWPTVARRAALALSNVRTDDDSAGVLLLRHCRTIFNEVGADALTPTTLVDRLCALEEAPWSEWRHGKPATSRSIALLLKPFGIASTSHTRAFGAVGRYYVRAHFEDAWASYLSNPPKKCVTNGTTDTVLKTKADFVPDKNRVPVQTERVRVPVTHVPDRPPQSGTKKPNKNNCVPSVPLVPDISGGVEGYDEWDVGEQ